MNDQDTVTRLELELLKLIREVDGGACLSGILLGDDHELAAHLIDAMGQVPPVEVS